MTTPIKLKITSTNNPSILKFETNEFITNHQSFEFKNIDESKPSPLAQQLFHLPFVKTVYISSQFIAIERYSIVEWHDVQDELAEQLETYLNSGNPVIIETKAPKKVPVTVYTESTPNPSVLKFVANKNLVPATLEFASIDDAKASPLATELFNFPFVKTVFMEKNYISITKYNRADWNDIAMELREFIRSYIETGKSIVNLNAKVIKEQSEDALEAAYENLDDTSKEIISILNKHIKPAVASDGGNIAFKSYNPETKHVSVLLQGACSGCPSSTLTLKSGIETMLKDMLKGRVETVEAING